MLLVELYVSDSVCTVVGGASVTGVKLQGERHSTRSRLMFLVSCWWNCTSVTVCVRWSVVRRWSQAAGARHKNKFWMIGVEIGAVRGYKF